MARTPQFWGCSKPVSIEESGGGHAQMDNLSFVGSQSLADLAEGVGAAELAEEHGDGLVPVGESSGMAFGVQFFHGMLEFGSGKELQELAEYVTKSIHSWPSFFVRLVFAEINLSHI